MRPLHGACLILLAGMGLSFPVFGGVVFDNGVPVSAINHGGYSCSDCPGSFETADQFVLGPNTTIVTDVHWWGMYFNASSNQADTFEVRIYADNPANPGLPTNVGTELYLAAVGSGARSSTGQVVAAGGGLGSGIMQGLPIYAYSAMLSTPLVATPGTTYWLSIVNTSAQGWVWALGELSDGNYIGQSTGSTPVFDSVYPARAAFQLTNDAVVPEPGTLALLGLGLAALGATLRRRQ